MIIVASLVSILSGCGDQSLSRERAQKLIENQDGWGGKFYEIKIPEADLIPVSDYRGPISTAQLNSTYKFLEKKGFVRVSLIHKKDT